MIVVGFKVGVGVSGSGSRCGSWSGSRSENGSGSSWVNRSHSVMYADASVGEGMHYQFTYHHSIPLTPASPFDNVG